MHVRQSCALFAAWAASFLVLAAGSAAVAEDAGRGALRALFAQPDPPTAEAQITALLDACKHDAARLEVLLAADTAYEAMQPGWLHREFTVTAGGKTVGSDFDLRVPAGYSPKRSWPLILAAHGTGGTGRGIGRLVERLLGEQVERYILLCPRLADETGRSARIYTAGPIQEQQHLKPLMWAKRHLNVDDDRVTMLGYSQGGHATWHVVTMFPHLFAAAVPMAGSPIFEGSPYTFLSYLPNLRNVAVWAIWGELDHPGGPDTLGDVEFNRVTAARLKTLGNTRYRGTELKGVGHSGCTPKAGELATFLAAHRRTAVPDHVVHHFHLAHHARGGCVEATRLARRPIDFEKDKKIRLTRRPPPDATLEQRLMLVTAVLEKRMFRLEARLDRAANTLTIRPTGIREIRLRVLDGLFDLDKAVTVRWGRRRWHGRIPASARCMAAHYARTRDAGALVLNELVLPLNGRATLRFPAAAADSRSD